MKKNDSRQSDGVLASAFRILARRDHTHKELALKLRQKGFDRVAIDDALSRCRELGYLDDAKTARVIAGSLARRGYGPLRVRQSLVQKGLDETLIEKTLARCSDEESQVTSARRILEKKTSRLSSETDPWRRRQYAYRFLAGRGFSSAVIKKALSEIEKPSS